MPNLIVCLYKSIKYVPILKNIFVFYIKIRWSWLIKGYIINIFLTMLFIQNLNSYK